MCVDLPFLLIIRFQVGEILWKVERRWDDIFVWLLLSVTLSLFYLSFRLKLPRVMIQWPWVIPKGLVTVRFSVLALGLSNPQTIIWATAGFPWTLCRCYISEVGPIGWNRHICRRVRVEAALTWLPPLDSPIYNIFYSKKACQYWIITCICRVKKVKFDRQSSRQRTLINLMCRGL